MAAFTQWRRFNFFNKEVVESNASGKTFDMIKDANLKCCTCGRGSLMFGDDIGNIHMVNHNFQVQSFRAYRLGVSHLFQVLQHNVLAAVGMDEEGVNPVIKIFNLDKRDKAGDPFCSRIQAAIPNNDPNDVSSFAVLSNLSMMAAGFAQGSIMLYKGDVLKDRHGNKMILLETGQSGPVTGLSFQTGEKAESFMFASTHMSVLSYYVSEKNPKMSVLEDSMGCPMFCTAMSDDVLENQFVVAASDGVYAYQPDCKGSYFAFDGDKVLARWYHGYLVVVYKDKTRIGHSSSALRPTTEKNMLTIYDMSEKIIVYSHALPGVKDVLYEWGSLYVLTSENVLVCLQEIDIHSKLEVLFKKNHYSLAVNMAKNQNLGEEGLMEIFTQYGNHLYSKGNYDDAITQFVKTIGHLEPSYVIRKFLDAQRIHNLTTYLQALHEIGEANEDHTTLLLNCFTKLKHTENLNKFIMCPETKLKFNVETAIRVCRQAGYYEHALQLAEKHQMHTWYLKIQLENTNKYEKALEYIRKLPYSEAEKNMKKYGKLLMKNVPEKTTKLLMDLCTDYKPTDAPLVSENYDSYDSNEKNRSNGEEFIHIFVNNSEMLVAFLQHIIKVEPRSSELVYNTLLELYLRQMLSCSDPKLKSKIEDETLDLLKEFSSLDYDTDQALVLCQMHCFRPGILFLYESAGLYQQILTYHMDHEAYGLVVETCRRHGSKDSSLWQQALTFFAQQEDVRCKEHIMQVLAHVDKNNLLPPLLVIQLLSRNAAVTLSVIKDYILQRLQKETDEIQQHEKVINQCVEDTKKMKEHINELKTSATFFQVTKCSLCNLNLELPSVHFLCKHSFHQHCFESYTENDQECPVCAGENRKILEHIREQEHALLNNRNLYDQFSSQIRQTRDGFSVIAEYFSRGVLNKVTLVTEAKVRGNSQISNPYEAGGSSSTNPFEDSPQSTGRIDPTLQKELRMMKQANRY